MEKGYKQVTMKDIVDACGISRGGLYLYFQNTGEVFEEVLKLEQAETDDVFLEYPKRGYAFRHSGSFFEGTEKGASLQRTLPEQGHI